MIAQPQPIARRETCGDLNEHEKNLLDLCMPVLCSGAQRGSHGMLKYFRVTHSGRIASNIIPGTGVLDVHDADMVMY
jgi:hypothetical protein